MEPEPLDGDPAHDNPPRPDDYPRCWLCGADLASGTCAGIGGELAECPFF